MLDKFFDWLSAKWAVKHTVPSTVDVIMFATMAATRTDLTAGSFSTMSKARDITDSFPGSCLVFSTYAYNEDLQLEYLRKSEYVSLLRYRYAGPARNTANEADLFFAAVQYLNPRSIVMVTDEWHSRSMLHALRHVFAGENPPQITVVTVPARTMISPDNPIKALRSPWQWALSNVLRHAFLVLVPGSHELMLKLKIRQPT